MSLSFSSLDLNQALLDNVASLGYATMTPVQAQSLPVILQGRDVIAQAQTGSGKTAAFGLAVLQSLQLDAFNTQALILCPTRELADQVAKALRQLARQIPNIKVLTLCGGTPFGPQAASLAHGAHIVVGTPGRVEDHLRKGNLKLKQVTTLVLDEADRMLDMGFQETLDKIMANMPSKRQTLLFSATYPEVIQDIANRVMTDPALIQVKDTHNQNSIEQLFYQIDHQPERQEAVVRLLSHFRPESVLIFCNTKHETIELAEELHANGFSVLALNGDFDQKQRDQAFVQFANKSVSVLVATDVAARGLDVEALDLVINYQLANELEVHTHRVGRTGRAGKRGRACTLFSGREQRKLDSLKQDWQQDFVIATLPAAKWPQTGYQSAMRTLMIDGGKNKKIRPGDILGALTGKQGIAGKAVGKIDIFHNRAYVAVTKDSVATALKKLNNGKLKGRSARARLLRS